MYRGDKTYLYLVSLSAPAPPRSSGFNLTDLMLESLLLTGTILTLLVVERTNGQVYNAVKQV